MTLVLEGPRLSLLRCLASYRDYEARHHADDPHWPKYVPLFGATEWPHHDVEMVLAVKEAAAVGHIEVLARPGYPFACSTVRITDAGYDHIKAHDAIGEAEQEVSR